MIDVAHNVFIGPTNTISTPARPGPATPPIPSTASPQELIFSSGSFARAATSGRNDSRAAMPGPSKTAPSAISPRISGIPRPRVRSSRGSAATAAALSRSAATLERRRPNRSTSAPPNSADSTSGTAAAAAATPASTALPVRCNTRIGIATATIALPVTDSAVEPSRPQTGTREGRVGVFVIVGLRSRVSVV